MISENSECKFHGRKWRHLTRAIIFAAAVNTKAGKEK